MDLAGVEIADNATARPNETVELNRATVSWFNATLADRTKSPHPFPSRARLWKVHFLLFWDGDFPSADRELHLYVRVS